MTRRSLLLAAVPFPADAVQWFAYDLHDFALIDRWGTDWGPIAVGSLLKPFLLLAYGRTHSQFPIVFCHGVRSGCWYQHGHRKQTVSEALPNSCNAYFLEIANLVQAAALEAVCLEYGLAAPFASADARALIGLGEGWPQNPQAVARAFGRLASNRSESDAASVLKGMARCADWGTAREIRMSCFAKTGTASCHHSVKGAGDGFVVALFPKEQPRHVLLASAHDKPGATVARAAHSIALSLV